jgi:RNA polymerase subunit RPABC4/transcription elongation factor Spt4
VTPNPFRYYNQNMLLALIIGYVVSLLLVIAPYAFLASSDWSGTLDGIGILLLLVESIFVMAYDWHGAVTLRGLARSEVMHKGQMVNTAGRYVLFYIFFPEIILPIYLICIVAGRRQAEEQRKLAMQQKIAIMEAQLGILPPTRGTCRACRRPLQVGAEFCQYCGVPVIERPKICPSCATTTLPDAKWCPKCGKRLA